MLRLYTFGGLQIKYDGQLVQLPTQKARLLLAYLFTFRNRPHPRSTLVGLLWPDLSEGKARRRLSDTLWRVRHMLGEHISADEEQLCFNSELSYWLDLHAFESGLQVAYDQTQTAATCLSHLTACVELYQGPFLDGFYEDWVLLERERLRLLYLQILQRLVKAHKQVGDYTAALQSAQHLVAAEPLQEAAQRELMRLYHLLDRDAEAIAQYRHCRDILQQELGVSPAPETQALYHTLRRRLATQKDVPAVHVPYPVRRSVINLDKPKLVSRDMERSELLDYLEKAASGQGGLVLLEGEAGIGKTRLVEELVAGAHWRNISVSIVNSRESEGGYFDTLLKLLQSDLTPLRLRQLARLMKPAQLQALATPLPSLSGLFPQMSPLPDLPPPQAHERIQHALVALILDLAHIAPHLWVFEDLQWADGETLSLLPLLLPRLPDSRVLVLLTGRHSELVANPAVWQTLQRLDRLAPFPRYALNRLDKEATTCLLDDLLDKEQPALADHLMQISEGVPLYIVETLKAWRDKGYLVPTERGTWHWKANLAKPGFCHFGHIVIDHRLSRLSPAANEILTVAAVAGQDVDFDLLACSCALNQHRTDLATPDDYLLASDELLRLGFLIETDTGYRFSHDQVRQTVYQKLPSAQRQCLHHKIALALQGLYPEQLEALAFHFSAAGKRKPAVDYLLRAAERACQIYAHQAALSCYNSLLDLLNPRQDCITRYDVLRERAQVFEWLGDREAQGCDLAEMLDLAQSLSDDARLALALKLRSEWHRLQGRYQLADKDAVTALDIYRRLGDDHQQASLLCQLGWNVVFTQAISKAADYFQEALPIYQALQDLQGQIDSLSGLAAAAKLKGDYGRVLDCFQECLILAEATGNPVRIGRAFSNAGIIHYSIGDIQVAENYLQKALYFKEQTGDRRSLAVTQFYLGLVESERGQFPAAQTQLAAALDVFREVQAHSWIADTLTALGCLALVNANFVSAADYLQTAHQRHREIGELSGAVEDLSFLAWVTLALGDETTAWQHSQTAITEMEKDRLKIEHSQELYYNHFRIAEATRRWAVARAALEKAGRALEAQVQRITPLAMREKYRSGRRFNRAITEALASLPPPGQLHVCLARADVPTHRRPAPDETIALTWTVDAGDEDAALAKSEGKVALRRHRLLRLLDQAQAAGALPTIKDLAGALDVSSRTIRADLAALRRQGQRIHTRGHRP